MKFSSCLLVAHGAVQVGQDLGVLERQAAFGTVVG